MARHQDAEAVVYHVQRRGGAGIDPGLWSCVQYDPATRDFGEGVDCNRGGSSDGV